MSKTSLFLLVTMITGFAFFQKAGAANDSGLFLPSSTDSILLSKAIISIQTGEKEFLFPPDPPKKRKIISALLALPFPCGFVGAHRVMMGTSPWVPVVYVATFGGCFGLLPLVDFCFIIFSKDITPFENNPHVFMWMK